MIDKVGLNIISKPVMTVSNLSFEHPLSNNELIELKNLLSSPIALSQIYFKDTVDIRTIETVKLMLEAFPNINDAAIEKYIMKDLNESEKEQLINMNFLNIETWNIAYSKKGNQYSMTSLIKYRTMEEWYKNILQEIENDTPLDKICYLYDKVKMFEYSDDPKYSGLPEIICEGRANSKGYNLIFSELLSRSGIKSTIGNVSKENYISLVIVDDGEYKINGIYIFDPSMDTIYKGQYKNNLARRMNYNFFGLTISQIQQLYDKKNMQEFLKVLSSEDDMEYNHRMYLTKVKDVNDIIQNIETNMGMSFDNIYGLVKTTATIPENKIINVITKTLDRYPDNIFNKDLLTKAIHDNYNTRNSELFTNKHVKKMSKVDTNK